MNRSAVLVSAAVCLLHGSPAVPPVLDLLSRVRVVDGRRMQVKAEARSGQASM